MRFRKLRLNNQDDNNHGLRIFVLVGVAVLVTFLSSLPSYDDDNESLPSSNGGGQPEEHQPDSATDGWTFYDGDLNECYNELERDEHDKRNPSQITSYAIHRWMGPDCSTLVHYELIRKAIYEVVLGKHPASPGTATSSDGVEKLRVFDAGCGLGAGLMWFEVGRYTSSRISLFSSRTELHLSQLLVFAFRQPSRVGSSSGTPSPRSSTDGSWKICRDTTLRPGCAPTTSRSASAIRHLTPCTASRRRYTLPASNAV